MTDKIIIFGNEYIKGDGMAEDVADYLNLDVEKCRTPEDLLDYDEKIVILDVVKNIKEPIIITDVDQLKVNNILSLHDFDLGYFLKLMKELGIPKDIKIIGLPLGGDVNKIAERVKEWI